MKINVAVISCRTARAYSDNLAVSFELREVSVNRCKAERRYLGF